jgi:hypothetical protein
MRKRHLVIAAASVLTALAATIGLGAVTAGSAQAASTVGRSWAGVRNS